jgi:predicted membrane protein
MNTDEKKKSLLFAILSKVLMVGGGFLLCWTMNDLYGMTSALVTLMLVHLSLFVYVLGASLIGRSFRFKNVKLHSQREMQDGILFAFLLMAAGALMICFNTELLNPVWKPFLLCWQLALFVAGAICLCRLQIIWGILLSTTGIFFLIEKAAAIFPNVIRYENFTSTYWPVIFSIAGIAIVLSFVIRPARCCKRHPKGNWNDYMPGEHENNDGKINYRFVFSGAEQVILDPVFKGGTIEATFGGMELNLRRTSLAEGKTYLYITTVFGGVDITAPDNWDIELVSKSFAGGVTDSRVKNIDKDHSRRLIIVAKCTFGGMTLR